MKAPEAMPSPIGPDELCARLGGRPRAAISLGSGLAAVARHLGLEPAATYDELGLAPAGVPGHIGQVSGGVVAGVPVLAFEGRLHLYEGHSLETVTAWVRTAIAAGVTETILTNAGGGLSPGLTPGDIMLITDHISLPGLAGYPAPAGAPAKYPWPYFIPQDGLYDAALAEATRKASEEAGIRLREGVYVMVHGPMYETPAERRALHRLGADVVGMSTVPEAQAAFASGAKVLALSVITNVADAAVPPTHEEVVEVGAAAVARLADLLRALLFRLGS